MNRSVEPSHIESRCPAFPYGKRKPAATTTGALLLGALLLAFPCLGSAQGWTPMPIIGPTQTACAPPNPDSIVLPDTTVSPYILQLANYLTTLMNEGQLTLAQVIAELAATAEYYNLPPAQVDRVLGLPAGTAQAAYDAELNPYDWYSYYFNPAAGMSGESPPDIGPLVLRYASTTELDVAWVLTAYHGYNYLQYYLVNTGSSLINDGNFTGLQPSTAYTFEVRTQVYNAYLQCWQTVVQTATFSTLGETSAPICSWYAGRGAKVDCGS